MIVRRTWLVVIGMVLGLGVARISSGGEHVSKPKGHDFTVVASDCFRPGHLLVRFAAKGNGKQRTAAEKRGILNSVGGGRLKRNYRRVPGLHLVELPERVPVGAALKAFNGAQGILYAEPDYGIEMTATEPDDTLWDDLWNMHNVAQEGYECDSDIDAPEAWDIATDSDLVVAVIDSGIDYEHEDLAGNMWQNPYEPTGDENEDGCPGVCNEDDDGDGLVDEDSAGREPNDPCYADDLDADDDENGYADDYYGWDFAEDCCDPMDFFGHGTHCAGILGAIGNNGKGVAGVCWDVEIMALKIMALGSSCGAGLLSDAASAIEYAVDNGAEVISNSWGCNIYSQAVYDAIKDAEANGILFVVAAGNLSSDNDTNTAYPSCYDCNNIVSVMGTNGDDERWLSSNYGATTVDIAAPSYAIMSCSWWSSYPNQYEKSAGTSMATPHVAGAAALVWSREPELTWQQVKDRLLNTVDKLPALDGLCVSEGRLNLHSVLDPNNATAIDDRVTNLTQCTLHSYIQDAINDACEGDIIEADRDTYFEDIDFDGKAITVRSTYPDDWPVVAETVIDACNATQAVLFDSSEDPNSVLSGFTVTGGSSYGVYCNGTDPCVVHCIITENGYGVVCAVGSLAQIKNNKIHNNTNYGIYAFTCSPTVKNNWIYQNDEGLRLVANPGSPKYPVIRNNTIADNTSGGIIAGYGPTFPTISNCIIWDNTDELSNGYSATYSCIKDATDAGRGSDPNSNITSDPCFVVDDYHLSEWSNCIDAGDPCQSYTGETDIDCAARVTGDEVDMGGDERTAE